MLIPAATTVRVSSKGQLVIPKDFRIAAGLETGARVVLEFQEDGTLSLRPLHTSIRELFGIAKRIKRVQTSATSTDEEAISAMIIEEDNRTKSGKRK